MRWRRRVAVMLAAVLIVWVGSSVAAVAYLMRSHHVPVNMPAKILEWPTREVTFKTSDGLELHGTLAGGGQRAVILAAGIGGNRTACVERAIRHLRAGWTVLLVDLRGTGMSAGDEVTFGWMERLDIVAAEKFLRGAGYERVAAHGTSLGAAAIVYSAQEGTRFEFVVLESVYDDIEHAFDHRVERHGLPSAMFAGMRLVTRWRLGVPLSALRPVDRVKDVACPILMLAGDSETQLPLAETMGIFQAARERKRLHVFAGGHHEDFLRRYGQEYDRVLGTFLADDASEDGPSKHKELE